MTPHSKNKYLVTISFLQNYWFAKPLYWCIYNKHAHCIPTSMSVASETKFCFQELVHSQCYCSPTIYSSL